VIGVFSGRLQPEDIRQIERQAPDLILLAGGTDGGNSAAPRANAAIIAQSELTCPIVFAGNQRIAADVEKQLTQVGKHVRVADNIMPSLGNIEVESCRRVIQELFLDSIVQAKGIDKARRLAGNILMPTPLAVAQAVELLAWGAGKEPGVGDLVAIDVGGATTDVHSAALGKPTREILTWHGIAEPPLKRTVEGDAGLRLSAPALMEMSGQDSVLACADLPDTPETRAMAFSRVQGWCSMPWTLAENHFDKFLEIGLARCAVRIATRRHAGRIETRWLPSGRGLVQHGKDLTQVGHVVGIGGVFAHGDDRTTILEEAQAKEEEDACLLPQDPRFLVDRQYVIYAIGLLSQDFPEAALRIMKNSLRI
jgi:uncharacterized protein (TIGR01319 family)